MKNGNGHILPKDIEAIEKKLKELHISLAEEMKSLGGHIKEEMPEDFKRSASIREEIELMEEEDSIEEDEIQLVEEALQRINDGSYGVCLKCGCQIPIGRLKTVPYAKYCVQCQEKIEGTGKRR